jgi:hypothetical protein
MPSLEEAPTASQMQRYKHDLSLDYPNIEPSLIDFIMFLYKQKTLSSITNEEGTDNTGSSISDE